MAMARMPIDLAAAVREIDPDVAAADEARMASLLDSLPTGTLELTVTFRDERAQNRYEPPV